MTKFDEAATAEVKVRRPYQAPRVEFLLKHRDTRNNAGTGFDGDIDTNNNLS